MKCFVLAFLLSLTLLGQDKPANTAILPVPKLENDAYDWEKRHEEILRIGKTINPEIVLIGDSITHFWGGEPKEKIVRGGDVWNELFGKYRILNLGFGWDRTQNVLWRLGNGEFDGLNPRLVIINIGTNNLSGTKNARKNTPPEILEGIGKIYDVVHSKAPDARIVIMGVFPRGEKPDNPYREPILEINLLLQEFTKDKGITYIDIGDKFLNQDGSISKDLMSDFCHPTPKGYKIWADALQNEISGISK